MNELCIYNTSSSNSNISNGRKQSANHSTVLGHDLAVHSTCIMCQCVAHMLHALIITCLCALYPIIVIISAIIGLA